MSFHSCLITGGAGFIGCAISKSVAARFSQVVAVDNLHPQVHKYSVRPSSLDSRVKLVLGDITEAQTWDNTLSEIRPDVVIHLASETGTGQSLNEAGRHSHTNVCGTTSMLDAMVRHNVLPRRIILASSRAVYGEGAWRKTTGEIFYPGQRSRAQLLRAEWDFPAAAALPARADQTVPKPVSVYGATKMAQENILSAWTQSKGSELIILRLQNVYGPGQSLTNSYTGIVPFFHQIARAGKSIPLYEDGNMQRDFVLIDDVKKAFMCALDSKTSHELPLDIGTGTGTTLSHLAELIARLYNAPAPHVSAQFRFGDVRHAFCDIQNSSYELNWKPERNLEDGLKELRCWLEEQVTHEERS